MIISSLRQKLQPGERLKVLFLNDLGFLYGAGLGHLRQIQSFLLLGHEVKGICWSQCEGPERNLPVIPHNSTGLWKGMKELSELSPDNGYSEAAIIDAILQEVLAFQPDLIIVGNLHAAKWPLEILLALRKLDTQVVAYMHDCYVTSGRCAYPGSCKLYETGCTENCPTANEYPPLDPARIPEQWNLRRKIFCGADGIPLATNSLWTLEMARRALQGLRYAEVVYLGIEENLFKPIDRILARRLLGLPENRFIILGGSTNVKEFRKGGHIFSEVIESLKTEVDFLVFGNASTEVNGVHATGLLRDYRKMPLLYSAADLFLGTALEEAFGQTLCEASACSIPIVAFNVGGVSEVARHDITARLVDEISASALLHEIRFFMDNPDARETFGKAGRAIVESEFTLKRQGERWMKYLKSIE
jgi:glycosyltransferase involved in cell wall biosynthesis